MFLTSALLFIGEEPLIYEKVTLGMTSPLFLVLLLQNLLLGHLNFALILRHVTKKQFNPLANKTTIFTCCFCLGVIISEYVLTITKESMMNIIWALFWIQMVGICHFIVYAIREMSEALGVPFFTTWDPE